MTEEQQQAIVAELREWLQTDEAERVAQVLIDEVRDLMPKVERLAEGIAELGPDAVDAAKEVTVDYFLWRALSEARTMLAAKCDQLGLPAYAVDELSEYYEALVGYRLDEELEYFDEDDTEEDI